MDIELFVTTAPSCKLILLSVSQYLLNEEGMFISHEFLKVMRLIFCQNHLIFSSLIVVHDPYDPGYRKKISFKNSLHSTSQTLK